MAKEIDEDVVKLSLDNSNYESNAQQSINTTQRLKKELNFDNSKAFSGLVKALNTIQFGEIEKGINKLNDRFSIAGTVGAKILENSIESVIGKAKGLFTAFSTVPLNSGFGKFDEMTKSIGTLYSQGKNTMEEVKEEVGKLAWYADETSYSLTDMTSNIGKFTAAGASLKESRIAMEGIANWAAKAGQNAQTASRAMYQISQAFGAGIMRKEDYKSIQTANMDTEEFRKKAIEAGVALGTLKKVGNDTYTSLAGKATFTTQQFTEGLTQGAWFTKDVMMKVFNEYSSSMDTLYDYYEKTGKTTSSIISDIDAGLALAKETGKSAEEIAKEAGDETSDTYKRLGADAAKTFHDIGAKIDEFSLKNFKAAQEARTFADAIDATKDAASSQWEGILEDIFGDYNEAVALWSGLADVLNDVFVGPLYNLRDLMDEWKQLGGRDDVIRAFVAVLNDLNHIIQPIKQAFQSVFPPKTAQDIKNITGNVADMAEGFSLSYDQMNSLFHGFQIFFTTIKNLMDDIGKVTKVVTDIFTNAFVPAVKTLYNVTKPILPLLTRILAVILVFKTIKGFISVFTSSMNPLGGGLKLVLGILLLMTANNVVKGLAKNSESFQKLTAAVTNSGPYKTLTSVLNTLGGALTKVFNVLAAIGSVIAERVGKQISDVKEQLSQIDFHTATPEKVGQAVGIVLASVLKAVIAAGKVVLTVVGGILVNVGKYIVTYGGRVLKSAWDTLAKLFKPSDKVTTSMGSITNAYAKSSAADGFKVMTADMKGVSDSAGSLADSFVKAGSVTAWFADLFFNKIPNALKTAFSSLGSFISKYQPILTSIINAASRIVVVLIYLKMLDRLDKTLNNVATSIGKLGNLGSIFDPFKSVANTIATMFKPSFGKTILQVAGAIAIAAASITLLALIPYDKMQRGAIAIAALAGGLSILSLILMEVSKSINTMGLVGIGSALAGFALAVLAVGHAFKVIATTVEGITDLPRVFEALGGAVLMFVGSMLLIDKVKVPLITTSISLIAFSLAAAIATNIFSKIALKLTKVFAEIVETIANAAPNMTKDTASMGVAIGAFAVVIGAAVLIISKAVSNLGHGIGMFALGVSALLISIKMLNKVDLSGIGSIVIAVVALTGAVMGIIGLVTYLDRLKGMGPKRIAAITKELKQISKMITRLAVSVLILSAAMKLVSTIPTDKMSASLQAITNFIVGIAGSLAILKAVKGDLKGVAGTIATLTVSIIALTFTAAALGNLNLTRSLAGILMLDSIMLAIGAMVLMIGKANLKKPLQTMLGVAALVVSIGASLYIAGMGLAKLSAVPIQNILAVLAGYAGILFILESFKTSGTNTMQSILAISLMMVSIGASLLMAGIGLSQLTNVPIANIITVLLGYSAILLVLGTMVTNKKTEMESILALSVLLVSIGGSLLLAGIGLSQLTNVPWQNILSATLGLSAVIASLALLNSAGGNIASLIGLSVMLVAVSASLGLFCAGLMLIKDVPVASIIAVAGSLAVLVGVAGAVGTYLPLAAPTLGALAVALLGVAAAEAAFGLAALAISYGMNLIIKAITELVQVLPAALKGIGEAGQYAGDIAKLAGSMVLLALGITALSTAVLLATPAVLAFSIASLGVSVGVTLVAKSISVMADAIKKFNDVVGPVVKAAKDWGGELANNFGNGIKKGVGIVADGAKSLATAVWNFLHYSGGPEMGPLAGNSMEIFGNESALQWISGFLNPVADGTAGAAGSLLGLDVKQGTKTGTEGAGTDAADSILTEIQNKMGEFNSKGVLAGINTEGGLQSILSGSKLDFSNWTSQIAGFFNGVNSTINATYKKNQSVSSDVGDAINEKLAIKNAGKKKSTQKDLNPFEDLKFEDFSKKIEESTKALGDNTSGLGANTGATGANTKAKGSNTDALKKQQEALAVLNKYEVYANEVAAKYSETLGNTVPMDQARAAVDALAEKLYEASEATESYGDTTEDRLTEIRKNFNKTFESIRDNLQSSMKSMSKWDKKAKDVLQPKKLLSNMKSQINGATSYATKLIQLQAKGINETWLKELENQGTEALAEINSLLLMNATDFAEANQLYAQRTIVANGAAISALSAQVLANTKAQIEAQAAAGDATAKQTLAMIEANNQAIDVLAKYQTEYETVQDVVEDTINSQMDLFEKFDNKTDLTSKDLIENMRSQVDGISEWANEITYLSTTAIDRGLLKKLTDLGPNGYEKVHAFVTMTSDEMAKANDLYARSLSLPQDKSEQIAKSYADSGEVSAKQYADALATYSQTNAQYQASINQFATATSDSMKKSLNGKGTEAAQQYTSEIATGISDNKQKGERAAMYAGEAVNDGAKDGLEGAHDLGKNWAQGLINGINSRKTDVYNAAYATGQSANSGFAKATDERSPSHIAEKMGTFWSLGIYKGVIALKDKIEGASTTVAKVLPTTLYSAINKANVLLNDPDLMASPVITPVVDLSGIQNGVASINSMMPSVYSFNGIDESKLPQNAMNSFSENFSMDTSHMNDGVITEIRSLKDEISSLKEQMSSMEVRMDSGALVGELVSPMDAALGSRAMRSRREK